MSEKKRRYVCAALIAVGICCLVLGVWREEYRVVFIKAVNICLECIGIG